MTIIEEVSLINEIVSYLWNLVDEKEQIDMSKINLLYEKLNDIDETDLDETDCQQKEIYELIVSLDEVLSYCQSGERGFEFSISQSIINIIDIMLQDVKIRIFYQRQDFKMLWFKMKLKPNLK